MLKYPNEKDESDLELAIQELFEQGVDSLSLFGVLGQRVDHLLYTLYLISRYPAKLVIESENETIFSVLKTEWIHSFPGQTLSLIPLGIVEGVTTKGLKWELQNASFGPLYMSLSNVCLQSSFSISFHSGNLLCCLQKENTRIK
ncbi:MAG: thiamine diphosphokinase [Parachlamydiaceae bacterium]|nr:MAG: thiamine diphosphokinase [Parachlamydiaceae bacterium]